MDNLLVGIEDFVPAAEEDDSEAGYFPFGEMVFSETGSGSLYNPEASAFQSSVPRSIRSQFESYPSIEEDDLEIDSDEEPDFIDQNDIPVSFHNALVLNENYQQELKQMLQLVSEALTTNLNRQARLKEEIDMIDNNKKPNVGNWKASILPQNPVIARNPVTVFYAPYFKDVNLYTHPPNR